MNKLSFFLVICCLVMTQKIIEAETTPAKRIKKATGATGRTIQVESRPIKKSTENKLNNSTATRIINRLIHEVTQELTHHADQAHRLIHEAHRLIDEVIATDEVIDDVIKVLINVRHVRHEVRLVLLALVELEKELKEKIKALVELEKELKEKIKALVAGLELEEPLNRLAGLEPLNRQLLNRLEEKAQLLNRHVLEDVVNRPLVHALEELVNRLGLEDVVNRLEVLNRHVLNRHEPGYEPGHVGLELAELVLNRHEVEEVLNRLEALNRQLAGRLEEVLNRLEELLNRHGQF